MTSTQVPPDQRAFLLSQAVQQEVTGRRKARLVSQTEYSAVIVRGQKPNHVAHLLGTVFTLGLWAPIWFVACLVEQERTVHLAVDPCGVVHETVGPRKG